MSAVPIAEALNLFALLKDRGIFSMHKANNKILPVTEAKVSFRIDDKEVRHAIKDMTLLREIMHDTDCISK